MKSGDLMESKEISKVLKKIIDVDQESHKQLKTMQEEIASKKRDLKAMIKERDDILENERKSEGEMIYHKILLEAQEEKQSIMTKCQSSIDDLEYLLSREMENLKEEVFKNLFPL